jgi:hypothetical protein
MTKTLNKPWIPIHTCGIITSLIAWKLARLYTARQPWTWLFVLATSVCLANLTLAKTGCVRGKEQKRKKKCVCVFYLKLRHNAFFFLNSAVDPFP